MEPFSISFFGGIILLGFISRYLGSSFGVGYGTLIVPVLLISGLESLNVIPAVLLSQGISASMASYAHHRYKNVDFSWGSSDLHIAMVLTILGIFGILMGIGIAINISDQLLRGYISVVIIAMGTLILLGTKYIYRFSWKKIYGLGLVASINKGVTGQLKSQSAKRRG